MNRSWRRFAPIAVALLTGAALWLVQKGASLTGPVLFSGAKALASGLILIGFSRPTKQVWRAAIRVALPLAASLSALAVALVRSEIPPVAIVFAAFLTLTMIGSRLMRQRAPQPLELVGLGLVAVALVLLWAGGLPANVLVPSGFAAAAMAAVVLISDRTAAAHRPIPFAAAAMVLAGLFLLALGFAAGELFPVTLHLSATLIAASLFAGIGLYLARVRSLELVGALTARRVLAFEPLGALGLAYALGTGATLYELSAMAAVIAGVWMTASSGRSAEIELTVAGR